MAITKTDVIAIASELSSVTDDAVWSAYISDSEFVIDLDAYESLKTGLRGYVQKRLVAHMMVSNGLGSGRSTRGEVTSERVGEVARTYASLGASSGSGSISDEDLRRTSYGRQIIAVRERYAGGPVWVGP